MSANSAPAAIRKLIKGTDWRIKTLPAVRFTVNRDIEATLATPTWSVSSLLPPTTQNEVHDDNVAAAKGELTTDDLRRLYMLAALPEAKIGRARWNMTATLQSQIHFVKEVQKVDTTGIEPLVAIRDETEAAKEKNMVTLEKLRPWLDQEETVGVNGTIRRRRSEEPAKPLNWDPFALGGINRENKRMGKFFFVKKQKE